MSWSGPVTGAAPYQAPPHANGQPVYGQHTPYQYGQQLPYGQYQSGPSFSGPAQRPQDNRPPKKKGNPIITRYPPPPGYRGPVQPQNAFNAHQYSAQYQPMPQSGILQAPPTQPVYPGQVYAAVTQQGYPAQSYGTPQPPSYMPSYPQGQGYPWSQQPRQPTQAPPQAPAYSGDHGYGAPQASYRQSAPHTATVDSNQRAYNQPAGWPQAPNQTSHLPQNQHRTYSGAANNDQPMMAPNTTPTPANANLVPFPQTSSQASSSAPYDSTTGNKSELYLAWDDWDFDFDGAIWPKSNEPVDPNLSLGVIIWHPAKQMTRALPATFEEAEEQSLKPTPEKLGNGESVSIFFTTENSHEAFLDVRQTDEWDFIKDDPAFVVFTDEELQQNLVPVEECIAQRDRPDQPSEIDAKTEDAEMHEADWSVMDNLEQALSASGEESKSADIGRECVSTKPQTQEDILASLGVTGLPKPVSGEPMAFAISSHEGKSSLPLPENPGVSLQPNAMTRPQADAQKDKSANGPCSTDSPTVPQRPYDSMSSSTVRRYPPPPPPSEHDRYDPWNPSNRQQQYRANGFNGGRGSPARSETSDGTAAGSDFGSGRPTEPSEQAITPGSKFERSDSSVSRKRSYDATDADDARLRQHDDYTKRKRRSQVDAAYSRR